MQVSTTCWLLLASIWCYLDTTVSHAIHNFGIHGGKPVKITEVPFMAIYSSKPGGWGCGAAIIHEQYLVSAAHCVNPEYKYITVGTDLTNEGKVYNISEVAINSAFNITGTENDYDYDICLIKLQDKLTFSKSVNKIKMADLSLTPTPGDIMTAIGFGAIENDEGSNQLLKVDVPFVSKDVCKEVFKNTTPPMKVTWQMLCAGGGGEAGKDNCQDFSGSPLVYNGKLYGLGSWNIGCGTNGLPGVYADVAALRVFADEIILYEGHTYSPNIALNNENLNN